MVDKEKNMEDFSFHVVKTEHERDMWIEHISFRESDHSLLIGVGVIFGLFIVLPLVVLAIVSNV